MKYNDKNFEQKVFQCVEELIFDKGIKGWNMDQLSAKVPIAKNTLYRIIGSKEEVVEKVILKYIKKNRAEMVRIMETESDYMTALKKVAQTFPQLLNSYYEKSMQDIFNEYPAIEVSTRENRDDLTDNIIAFIQKGIDSNKLRRDVNAKSLFELFLVIIIGYIKQGFKGDAMTAKMSEAFDYIIDGVKN